MIIGTITLLLSILSVPLAQSSTISRRPMAKESPKGLPVDSAPVQLSPDATVRYDLARDVYIFSYKRFDGEIVHMGFELATKVDVVPEGKVERVSAGKNSEFRYRYTLHSLPTSKQGVNWLAIITNHPVQRPSSPHAGWEFRTPPKPERITQRKPGISWSDGRGSPDVPLPSLPAFTDEMAKLWSNRKYHPPLAGGPYVRPIQLGLVPGKRLEGFAFASAWLPGIVRCYAAGAHFMPVTFGEPPLEIGELTFKNSFLFVAGKTVGPVLENPPRDALETLNQLVAWVREAERLGWIGSKNLVEQITSRLAKARSHWTSGKWRAAAQELATIIAMAESEKEVGITPELYAILVFNSEALRALAFTN